MQKYVRVAFERIGIDPDSPRKPPCEVCKDPSDDVHHIRGRKGKFMLDPKNLIFLCRPCHNNYTRIKKSDLEQIVIENEGRYLGR